MIAAEADVTAAAPCPLLKYRDRLEGAGEPRLVRIYNIRHGTAVARALEMLDELLAHGPVRSVEVRANAKRAGLSWAATRRAADALPVCAIHQGYGGFDTWWWVRGTARAIRTLSS